MKCPALNLLSGGSGFSFSVDELPAKATSLVNPEQVGFKAPTTRLCTSRISSKRRRGVNTSGWDLTNRGLGETQAL